MSTEYQIKCKFEHNEPFTRVTRVISPILGRKDAHSSRRGTGYISRIHVSSARVINLRRRSALLILENSFPLLATRRNNSKLNTHIILYWGFGVVLGLGDVLAAAGPERAASTIGGGDRL